MGKGRIQKWAGGGCLGKHQYQLELLSYNGRVYVVSEKQRYLLVFMEWPGVIFDSMS